MNKKEKIDFIANTLFEIYGDSKIELDYTTEFQLLIAVIMSAQTTDKQVNKVTKVLFETIKIPSDVNKLGIEKIKNIISSIGFFNNKAKYIFETGNILATKYNSIIPDTLEELQKLPGVGIKTAKVVLSNLYSKPYIAVDTHVHRVLNRLGVVSTKSPEETDKLVEKIFSVDQKKYLHHNIVLFGRYHCKAIKPKCLECRLREVCKFK